MAAAKKVSKSKKKAVAKKGTAAKKSTPASGKKKAVTKKTVESGAAEKAPAKKKAASAAPTKKTAAASQAKKAPAAPKARKAKSPFDSRFLEQMRKLLVTERETYDRQAIMLQAEADSLVQDIDPGDVQFDEESGEGDTIAVERGRDLALAAKAREMIEEIDHAMSKFELGTYGICEISGDPIPNERLEAIPWAREQVEYKVGGFGRR